MARTRLARSARRRCWVPCSELTGHRPRRGPAGTPVSPSHDVFRRLGRRRRRQNTLGGTCSGGVFSTSFVAKPALPVNLVGLSCVEVIGTRFRRGLAGLAEPLPAEDARLGCRGLGLSRADHLPDRRARDRGARTSRSPLSGHEKTRTSREVRVRCSEALPVPADGRGHAASRRAAARSAGQTLAFIPGQGRPEFDARTLPHPAVLAVREGAGRTLPMRAPFRQPAFSRRLHRRGAGRACRRDPLG